MVSKSLMTFNSQVRVEAVQGYVIGEMHFASSHYKFHINEKSAKGSPVGVVELRNPSDSVDPRITSVDPENMNGSTLHFCHVFALLVFQLFRVLLFGNEGNRQCP